MLGLKPGSKLSRSVLTSMTVGQLEFILNYLLSQIEILNEDLVQFLIARDELAIEQVKIFNAQVPNKFWRIGVPTRDSFLRRICKVCSLS